MMNLIITIDELVKLGKIKRVIENYTCSEIKENVLSQNFRVKYSVVLIDGAAMLTGTIDGEIKIECSCCLETFDYLMSFNISRAYLLEDKVIDVGDELRQVVVLNLPAKPLCKETCAGLCPVCGKNLNISQCTCGQNRIDPRWEKLYIK